MKYFMLVIINCTLMNGQTYLFEKFPRLQNTIPYTCLCDLPTPIERLHQLEDYSGVKNLFIKRDDLSGRVLADGSRLYGGNKPRKLEFLLADAINKNAHTVITFGCVGSNHALATATYAHHLGLKSLLMLKHQPNSQVVRTNLLLDAQCGAQMHFFQNNEQRSQASELLMQADKGIYFIPTGGSNVIGALGFVNAGLELADQIEKGCMPVPDFIYVATGSCGTIAGLLLGLKVAGVKTKLVAVCVEPEDSPDWFLNKIKELYDQITTLLQSLDETFFCAPFDCDDLILQKKWMGSEYGFFIPEVSKAIALFKKVEGIQLDGTYSGKALAALLQDSQSEALKDKTILFWNTFCSAEIAEYMPSYQQLPPAFHTYFEQDVQWEE